MTCPVCKGERWVCENHPGQPWSPEGCRCGAGDPCVCNQGPEVLNPPGFKVLASTRDEDGYLQ